MMSTQQNNITEIYFYLPYLVIFITRMDVNHLYKNIAARVGLIKNTV